MFWTVITYILFIIGFPLLIKGADFLVDGASAIAKKYGLSPFVIGITIVAFGTSMPELLVNLFSSAEGASGLAIGNVIGSNISNILLVLGVSAFISPLVLEKGTVWKAIPLSLLAAVMVLIMSNDTILEGRNFSELSRIDGLVLIAFFVIFLYYTFGISRVSGEETQKIETMSLKKSYLYVAIGLIGLFIGGKWLVDGAVFMASKLGVSQSLIGLTIVAVGTSLPELAASVVAALKQKSDIAVGNIVGSNIFNIFWVLAVSAVVRPLKFSTSLNFDIIILIAASMLLFMFMFIGRKRTLEKWQGFSFIVFYIIYIVYLVYRG